MARFCVWGLSMESMVYSLGMIIYSSLPGKSADCRHDFFCSFFFVRLSRTRAKILDTVRKSVFETRVWVCVTSTHTTNYYIHHDHATLEWNETFSSVATAAGALYGSNDCHSTKRHCRTDCFAS